MEHTKNMRFGPCVTNPNTREWSAAASLFGSLAHQSGGRFDIGRWFWFLLWSQRMASHQVSVRLKFSVQVIYRVALF
jgi:hypothetical protein